jgi:tRNA1(Val) A37 N6-methylase TrmN6
MATLAALRDRGRHGSAGPLPVAGLPADLLADIEAELRACPGDPAAPGRVYEARLAADRTARRAAGAYYTPPALIDFAVDRALAGLPPDAPIIDPSCGAGAFLLAAHRRGFTNLHGLDLDPIAAAVCRLSLALAGWEGDTPRVGNALSPQRNSDELRFSAVIGNPPWGQKGLKYTRAEAADLRARFVTARGVLDPFKLFVERAHELLVPGGRWAFVLPDIILLKNEQPVRDLILAGSAIEHIAHLTTPFPGVNLDAVIIVGRRTPEGPPADHRVMVWHGLGATPTRSVAQATFAELDEHRFNLYLDEPALALLRKLSAGPRLGERFEVHEGVHSGNARARLFLDAPHGDTCAPLIAGGDEVAPFAITWAGRWLDRDPAAIGRDRGGYANLGRAAWHTVPKLLVRRTGDRVIAAFDGEGRFASNNLFLVLPRAGAGADIAELRGLEALLNSRLSTWFFRAIQPRTGRLFAELKIKHLSAFPLPGELAALAAVPRAELDAAVARMFGLNEAEQALVE